jgi:peptide/nickel transport system substrate-binding protein
MGYRKWRGWIVLCAMMALPALSMAQQATKKSDVELSREGPAALATAHGEKPRYGGKFISAGVEAVPLYDMHQTSFGGVYAATAPAYNCLVRTSPYDPMALEIFPELARSWEVSPDGQTVTFHLHQGVKWHDGMAFSSADVLYTIERIMHPPQGMVSPRGPVFNALIERVETPDANTIVVHGKGPSGLLLSLFANGWNVIIPKHIAEKDPVNALKTRVIGTGPFKLKEPPTSALWQYERNPDYFLKGLPYLDALEIHLITDPQALAAAILSKRVFWTNSYVTSTLDRDIAQSVVQQNTNLVLSKVPSLAISYLSMHTGKAPFDDIRVRQALSEALRREALTEFGKQTGLIGTGNYPAGPWAMPQPMRDQLVGYGPDMAKRTAHAKALLADYEKDKGRIDWSKVKLNCATNLPITCDNAQVIQQLLKKIGANIVLEPMLLAQHRGNEVSGDYVLSTLLAGFDFDDPIDVFGQLYVSKGGRWYQRSSIPELDKLFEQQKFMVEPEARKQVIYAMDKLAMNDAAFLILQWVDAFHVRWNFIKGWLATPNARSTNARLDYVWMDLPELPHVRSAAP